MSSLFEYEVVRQAAAAQIAPSVLSDRVKADRLLFLLCFVGCTISDAGLNLKNEDSFSGELLSEGGVPLGFLDSYFEVKKRLRSDAEKRGYPFDDDYKPSSNDRVRLSAAFSKGWHQVSSFRLEPFMEKLFETGSVMLLLKDSAGDTAYRCEAALVHCRPMVTPGLHLRVSPASSGTERPDTADTHLLLQAAEELKDRKCGSHLC